MSEQATNGYDEGCCWTWIRDHCPGSKCTCRCHTDYPPPIDWKARAEVANAELARLTGDGAAMREQLAEAERINEEWRKGYQQKVRMLGRSVADHEIAKIERDEARDQLAESRAREHVLVIVGDKLSRHMEWIIEEPNEGLVPEVLDAIKESAGEDVAHWLNSIRQFGFKRPDQPAPDDVAPAAVREEDS